MTLDLKPVCPGPTVQDGFNFYPTLGNLTKLKGIFNIPSIEIDKDSEIFSYLVSTVRPGAKSQGYLSLLKRFLEIVCAGFPPPEISGSLDENFSFEKNFFSRKFRQRGFRFLRKKRKNLHLKNRQHKYWLGFKP